MWLICLHLNCSSKLKNANMSCRLTLMYLALCQCVSEYDGIELKNTAVQSPHQK